MLSKPTISGLGLPIHGAFDVAEEGRTGSAMAVTAPHMLAVQVHFVMEVMVNCDVKSANLVYIPHDLLELPAVPSFSEAGGGVGEEEEGVDHLVQQGLLELIARAVLQERRGEFDGTGVIAGVRAGASAEGHLLAPLHVALFQALLEEEAVVVAEHLVDVQDLVVIVAPEEFILHFPPIIPASNTHTFNQYHPFTIIPQRLNHPMDVIVLASVRRLLSSSLPLDRLRLQCFLAEVMAQRRFQKTGSRESSARWEATSWLHSLCFLGLRAMMVCVVLKSLLASCPSDSRRRVWQQSFTCCKIKFSVSFSCISDRNDSLSVLIFCIFSISRRVSDFILLRPSSSYILSLQCEIYFQKSLRKDSNYRQQSRWTSNSSAFHCLRLASKTSTSLRVSASSRFTVAIVFYFDEMVVRLSWISPQRALICISRHLICSQWVCRYSCSWYSLCRRELSQFLVHPISQTYFRRVKLSKRSNSQYLSIQRWFSEVFYSSLTARASRRMLCYACSLMSHYASTIPRMRLAFQIWLNILLFSSQICAQFLAFKEFIY